ncbi:MAG TPA: hypothetical protein VMU17_06570 [Elusimicrobiota bacterium]|nr:hypothetical protein [Elusimicrobiota bacterium]
MKITKLFLAAVPFALTVFSLALATDATAKSLEVLTFNWTGKTAKSEECVNRDCAKFLLSQTPVEKLIPEPSSGTARLQAFFVEGSTGTSQPAACQMNYDVNTTTLAYVNVYGTPTSLTCDIKP